MTTENRHKCTKSRYQRISCNVKKLVSTLFVSSVLADCYRVVLLSACVYTSTASVIFLRVSGWSYEWKACYKYL